MDIEGGSQDIDAYVEDLMDNEPKRQAHLRYTVHGVGCVVDLPSFFFTLRSIRGNMVTAALSLLVRGFELVLPHAASKGVAELIAFTLAYFTDLNAMMRWISIQYLLLRQDVTLPISD